MGAANNTSTVSNALSPFIYANRILGMSPFSRDFHPSNPAILYSIFIFTAVAIWLVLSLGGFTNIVVDKSVPSAIASQIIVIAYSVCMELQIASGFLKMRSNLKQLYARLDFFDLYYYHGSSNVNDRLRKSVIIQLVALVLLLVSFSIVDINAFWSGKKIPVAYLIGVYVIHFSALLLALQFVNLVLVLKSRYSYLITIIVETFDLKQSIYSDTDAVDKQTSRQPSVKSYLFVVAERKLKACNDINFREEVNKMRKMYDQLHQVGVLINSVSGLGLLGVLVSFLTELVGSAHVLIVLASSLAELDGEMFSFNLIIVAAIFLWCIQTICIFALIIVPCHQTTGEVVKIGCLVQHCLLLDDIGDGAKKELKYFSRQLANDSLRFHVCGMFSVDMTLLLSVTALFGTYIAVMLSFK